MASSHDTHQPPATIRPRLTRVPGPEAIRATISAHDPASPAAMRGKIAAELHDGQWTLLIDGQHGSQLLHLDLTMSLGDGLALIATALAAVSTEASYPVPDITESCEVTTRDSRNYGS